MDAAHVETLLPADTFPGTGILLALDVDGVLNNIDVELWGRNRRAGQSPENARPPVAEGFERRLVRKAHGSKFWVDINPRVISALDTFIQTNDIELCWLTTWGPSVRALIEQGLDGRLAGGFVLEKPQRSQGFLPFQWKRPALRSRIEAAQQPLIWADDEEIALARGSRNFENDPIFAVPHVLFEPAPTVGLTVDDVAAMQQFATALEVEVCQFGATTIELQARLGVRLPAFQTWMSGQTTAVCPEHGTVVYRSDLERFLTGGHGFD